MPIAIIGLVKVGGIDGLFDAVRETKLGDAGLHTWANTGGSDNPLGVSWWGIVFGLGFVLSFGYWTTNFAEVQRGASGFSNIMDYIQALFSLFNAPLFAAFIIGMFWKRMTAWAGFWALLLGTLAAFITYAGYKWFGWFTFGSDLDESFWGAGIAFVTVAIVSVIVTLFTTRKTDEELSGLVYGIGSHDLRADAIAGDTAWYRSPVLMGVGALILAVAFYLPFL